MSPQQSFAPRAALAGISFDTNDIADHVVNAFMPALRKQMPSLIDAAIPTVERKLPEVVGRSAPAIVDSLVPVVQKKVPVLIDAAWPPIQERLRLEMENAVRQNVPFATFTTTYGPALALALGSLVVGASAIVVFRAYRDGI